MRYEVLGPLRVLRDGASVDLGGAAKPRLVLATLLACADRRVPIGTLIDSVWPDQPPPSARRNLQVYVHQLRQALGADSVVTDQDGYVLVTDGRTDAADLARLHADGVEALRAADRQRAAALFREGLDLWRGPAFGEFVDCPAMAQEAQRLERLRLSTAEQWADTELMAGLPSPRLVGDLLELVHANPYHERLHAQLMQALAQVGRPAEALRLFAEMRSRLRVELGAEPGPLLRRTHEAVLRGEVVFDDGRPRPAQLPRDPDFVGRNHDLTRLTELAGAGGLVVISGTAGVGKTSLAVHWAHQVAEQFPGGQLYVDLRGHDEVTDPVQPEDAVRGLLDALLVPSEQMPPGLAAKTGLLRSVLAARPVLLLLDNARDAAQVRPLLPGAGPSMVLVTSRHQLDGLTVTEGAHPLVLRELTTHEATQLLSRRIGPDRIRAEPAAVSEIVARCAGLALALSVVAARAAVQPGRPLRAIAAELHDGLDAFGGGDRATDLRSVFSGSYRALRAADGRLFRLIGLHPGSDFTAPAAAAIAGDDLTRVGPQLASLCRAHLLAEPIDGRYAMHDLLRDYAAELVAVEDGPADRRGAATRLLDYYLVAAHRGSSELYPHRTHIDLPAGLKEVGQEPSDYAEAVAWFGAEHSVLLAVIDMAVRDGFDTHAWQLAWTLGTYLDRRRHWDDLRSICGKALAAAVRLDDPLAQAHSLHGLGVALANLDEPAQAHRYHAAAIELFDGRNAIAESQTHLMRAVLYGREGKPECALRHAQRALDLCTTSGFDPGRARSLNAVGWFKAVLGRAVEARADCEEAIALLRIVGDQHVEAAALDSLGYVHHQLGERSAATRYYRDAIQLWRVIGDRSSEVSGLHRLGDLLLAYGEVSGAAAAWRSALAIPEQADHPEVNEVRRRLSQLSDH